MQINIYKDKMLGARLFGASVLYSAKPIPREDVPPGWRCYDLRGTARHPDEPHSLVEMAEENHAGSILLLPAAEKRAFPVQTGQEYVPIDRDISHPGRVLR